MISDTTGTLCAYPVDAVRPVGKSTGTLEATLGLVK